MDIHLKDDFMNVRKITSLTLIFSFLLLLLTGVVLYVVPAGRIAYWANWTFLALTKEQWGALHTTSGLVGLIAAAIHIYFNWGPIVQYMRNKSREVQVLNVNFTVALAFTAFVVAGTLIGIPPFTWVLDLGTSIKDTAAETYGEPPYAHAELSTIGQFTRNIGIDTQQAMDILSGQGFAPDSAGQTIADLSGKYDVAPQRIYEVLKEATHGTYPELPQAPPMGIGRRTIASICDQYGLDTGAALRALEASGFAAQAGQTLKEIAEAHDAESTELYEVLKTVERKAVQ